MQCPHDHQLGVRSMHARHLLGPLAQGLTLVRGIHLCDHAKCDQPSNLYKHVALIHEVFPHKPTDNSFRKTVNATTPRELSHLNNHTPGVACCCSGGMVDDGAAAVAEGVALRPPEYSRDFRSGAVRGLA